MTIKAAAACLLTLAGSVATAAAPASVERVESGLLPPVTIVGEPTRTMRLAERMAHHRVPAVSVAVIEDGRIAWSRAYGSLDRGGARPATERTLFQAGSLSKPLTAAASLTLVQAGRLSLDGPVNDYLKLWKVPPADGLAGKPVTLRYILGHTAGFTVHGFRGYDSGAPLPSLRQILDGAPPANSRPVRVDTMPGTAFRYSGGGYLVAQRLIEDVTGRPFAAAMDSTLLRPLAMARSTFAQPLPARLAPLAAVGHRPDGGAVPGGWHVFPEQAAAGLWTTPGDLARFVLWVMRGVRDGAAPDHRSVAARLIEPQTYVPGGARIGLGLVLDGTGPRPRFSHSGSTPGYRAFMIGFPETNQGAAIMASSDTSPELIKEILRALAAEYRWPERFHRMVRPIAVDQARLKGLSGTYSFESRERKGEEMHILVSVDGGALRAKLPDGSDRRLVAESDMRFVDPESETVLLFEAPDRVRIPALGIAAERNRKPEGASK